MKRVADQAIIERLQQQIISLQANKPSSEPSFRMNLGKMESAFPCKVFPRGVIHELISTTSEAATSTSGFLSVVIGKLIQQSRLCVWVSTPPRRSIFPPAMKGFGIDPERIIFIDASKRDTLWIVEEALKVEALAAVVGEFTELTFNDSRRLQLAVERSQVTGFLHRFQPRTENTVACVSRWKVTPLASETPDGMPGLGFPQWNVQLLKVRNGQPGEWQVQWSNKGLEYIEKPIIDIPQPYEQETA